MKTGSALPALPASGAIRGATRPRLFSAPSRIASYTAGDDAVELAADAGLILDEWQAWVLRQAMAERDDFTFAAFEVGIVCARQNGKNAIVEARQLAGLFNHHHRLQIHTAHEFKAAQEHFLRVRDLVDSKDAYRRKVARIMTSHGEEGIELKATPCLVMGSANRFVRRSVKSRLRFLARSSGSGRAFSCDALYYDEAMKLALEQVSASFPTMSARWNPQIWYTGSAGDETSVQLGSVRDRGIAGGDPDLLFVEFSIDPHTEFCNLDPGRGPVCTAHDDPHDPRSWAKANPGIPHRITLAYIAKEMRAMSPTGVSVAPPDGFAREILSVGSWPVSADGWAVISKDMWEARRDPAGSDAERPARPLCLAVDSTPDQSASAIGLAGLRPSDGRMVIQVPVGDDGMPDHRAGTGWLIPRLVQLSGRVRPCAVVIDPRGPLGEDFALAAEKAGLRVERITGADVAGAFAWFYRACKEDTVRHLGQGSLTNGLAGAATRDVGDGGKAWARKNTSIDICALVACSFAGWGRGKFGRGGYDLSKSVAGATAPPTAEELAPGLAAGLAPVRTLEQIALEDM